MKIRVLDFISPSSAYLIFMKCWQYIQDDKRVPGQWIYVLIDNESKQSYNTETFQVELDEPSRWTTESISFNFPFALGSVLLILQPYIIKNGEQIKISSRVLLIHFLNMQTIMRALKEQRDSSFYRPDYRTYAGKGSTN